MKLNPPTPQLGGFTPLSLRDISPKGELILCTELDPLQGVGREADRGSELFENFNSFFYRRMGCEKCIERY